MFNAISWQGYWTALALLTAFYYAAILLLFFRNDLKAWFSRERLFAPTAQDAVSGHSHPNTQAQPSLFGEDEGADFKLPAADTEEQRVYACMDELNAFFDAARSRKWQQEELLQALRRILSKYPTLKDSEYKVSLGHVIATQCERHCSIHLKAGDVVGLR